MYVRFLFFVTFGLDFYLFLAEPQGKGENRYNRLNTKTILTTVSFQISSRAACTHIPDGDIFVSLSHPNRWGSEEEIGDETILIGKVHLQFQTPRC